MNILICSVGRRVQLIDSFKKELNEIGGKVFAVDCDPTAPALYHADFYEIVPRIDHPEYISVLKSLCQKYHIKGILSLIDPELTLLASHKEEFKKEGVQVLVSDRDVIDICFDKFLTHIFLESEGLPSVPTYISLEKVKEALNKGKLQFPLIVKPRNGSASIGVQLVGNWHELHQLLEVNNQFIVQPYMTGDEYCVECYVDLLTMENSDLFSKRKFNMRAGETDKSIVVKDRMLHQMTEKLLFALKPVGPIDIDLFKTERGYVISEINPRFGGGYPYAYAMGHNFIQKIIYNLQGIRNPSLMPYEGPYEEGATMVRYDHFVVLNDLKEPSVSMSK